MIFIQLRERIALLEKLGKYLQSGDPAWEEAMDEAYRKNNWFLPRFSAMAGQYFASKNLNGAILREAAEKYRLPAHPAQPKNIGVGKAGNIPLVGLHDWTMVFLSGHYARIKRSSKDEVLITHLTAKMQEWEPAASAYFRFEPMLKGCDAYIATGSNNSARYFEYYFGKYPHIIRKNRSSVAILDGSETPDELRRLAGDVYLYFGLGCRNVTQLHVPEGYDFEPLLGIFKEFDWMADHHRYKNNYDYQLALLILNRQYYMSNSSLILVENESVFSPISVLHYRYYSDAAERLKQLQNDASIQCIVGKGQVPFGKAQEPGLLDFADGVDTLNFLQQW